jgi:hypothetical protein
MQSIVFAFCAKGYTTVVITSRTCIARVWMIKLHSRSVIAQGVLIMIPCPPNFTHIGHPVFHSKLPDSRRREIFVISL